MNNIQALLQAKIAAKQAELKAEPSKAQAVVTKPAEEAPEAFITVKAAMLKAFTATKVSGHPDQLDPMPKGIGIKPLVVDEYAPNTLKDKIAHIQSTASNPS